MNISFDWNLSGESVSSGSLDDYIKAFIEGTEYDTASAVRYVTREVLSRVVERTPVNTHRAVAGWSAAGRALDVSVPSSSKSQAGDSSYRERLTGKNPRVEFNNNVPYVIYLEYGWSKQAPLGMVRISVAEVQSAGVLPAILTRSYEKRWEDPSKWYEISDDVLTRGLSRVKTVVPSRRSVAAHLSAELRQRRAQHRSSAALTKMQKSFSTTARKRK